MRRRCVKNCFLSYDLTTGQLVHWYTLEVRACKVKHLHLSSVLCRRVNNCILMTRSIDTPSAVALTVLSSVLIILHHRAGRNTQDPEAFCPLRVLFGRLRVHAHVSTTQLSGVLTTVLPTQSRVLPYTDVVLFSLIPSFQTAQSLEAHPRQPQFTHSISWFSLSWSLGTRQMQVDRKFVSFVWMQRVQHNYPMLAPTHIATPLPSTHLLIALLLPFGNQHSVRIPVLEQVIVERLADGLLLVV
jgi:hypothetical protein